MGLDHDLRAVGTAERMADSLAMTSTRAHGFLRFVRYEIAQTPPMTSSGIGLSR
jgi:hypothetical protein